MLQYALSAQHLPPTLHSATRGFYYGRIIPHDYGFEQDQLWLLINKKKMHHQLADWGTNRDVEFSTPI